MRYAAKDVDQGECRGGDEQWTRGLMLKAEHGGKAIHVRWAAPELEHRNPGAVCTGRDWRHLCFPPCTASGPKALRRYLGGSGSQGGQSRRGKSAVTASQSAGPKHMTPERNRAKGPSGPGANSGGLVVHRKLCANLVSRKADNKLGIDDILGHRTSPSAKVTDIGLRVSEYRGL